MSQNQTYEAQVKTGNTMMLHLSCSIRKSYCQRWWLLLDSLSISTSMELYSNLKYWALLNIPSNSTLSHKWSMLFLCNLSLRSVLLGITDTSLFPVFPASQMQDFTGCPSLMFWQVLLFPGSPGSLCPVGNWFLAWVYENLTPVLGLGLGQLFAAAPQIMCMVVAVPAHLFHWQTLHCFRYMEVEEYWWILAVLVWKQLGKPVFQDLCCLHKREDRSQA